MLRIGSLPWLWLTKGRFLSYKVRGWSRADRYRNLCICLKRTDRNLPKPCDLTHTPTNYLQETNITSLLELGRLQKHYSPSHSTRSIRLGQRCSNWGADCPLNNTAHSLVDGEDLMALDILLPFQCSLICTPQKLYTNILSYLFCSVQYRRQMIKPRNVISVYTTHKL